ncbi:MAG: hypothetical protein KGJ80_12475 [Chloroflexota bacterium]|nr:hypothetical protein [Chloroflexota bacterium]
MKRIKLSLALAFALTLLATQLALAHERRTIGKYEFVVGWGNEPAYANQPNAISLTVTDAETKRPVSNLDKTLQAEVIFGARSMVVPLIKSDENPGTYTGAFVPTRVGTYIFHFSGKILEQTIDGKFESGPNTFDDVQDIAALEFPDKALTRLQMAAQLKVAQDAASSAQTFAYIGVGVGVLGLIVGGLALTRRK